jgi:glutathionylspermidine synthase
MLWSNKALLAVLWDVYPGHELLLPSYLDGPRALQQHVRKPLLDREGANVSIADGSRSFDTGGAFADGPWLYQGIGPIPCVDGNWVVLGSWLVDGEPCGLGMREGRTPDSQCGPLRPTPLLKWAGLRCVQSVHGEFAQRGSRGGGQ